MTFIKIILIAMTALWLGACSSKEYSKQESAFIVLKTPTFRHADLGFIYEGHDSLKVEIYSSGQPVMRLDITEDNVCMSLFECMDKESFNKTVLHASYPNNVLENIFKAQKIFDGQNMLKTRNGFTQMIKETNKYEIEYSVLNKEVLFRDRINHILIKVKRMGQ
ncbi:MAG: Unknown protein [uncultured Sulfurovum sp.]|uniref:Lipoprotein n=1 Tax=uncultured Sulfurovum sp. TaxID=269237 RepID=A0A6S6THP5_9BACT|nr:MAG: Unknown protein [uncultured Sulfurovum sp.]